MQLSDLLPGDVLLYKGRGVFGWLTRTKTWADVGHVEVYVGDGISVTAAKHKGVNYYPVNLGKDLRYVLRPITSVDITSGVEWFESNARGQKYDTWGLFKAFYLRKSGAKDKMWCSEIVDAFLRACGVNVFASDLPPDAVAPSQFLQTNDLTKVWAYKEKQ